MWVSVDDKLPLQNDYQSSYDEVKVIVTDGVNVSCELYCIGGNHIGKPWGKFSDYGDIKVITHWMPLPKPPEA